MRYILLISLLLVSCASEKIAGPVQESETVERGCYYDRPVVILESYTLTSLVVYNDTGDSVLADSKVIDDPEYCW